MTGASILNRPSPIEVEEQKGQRHTDGVYSTWDAAPLAARFLKQGLCQHA